MDFCIDGEWSDDLYFAYLERIKVGQEEEKFINLTPHEIRLNDGRVFPPSGTVARVKTEYGKFDENGIASVTYGTPTGLPEEEDGVFFIVSGLLKAACPDRDDLVCPATGHPACVRENVQVVSVPGFTR